MGRRHLCSRRMWSHSAWREPCELSSGLVLGWACSALLGAGCIVQGSLGTAFVCTVIVMILELFMYIYSVLAMWAMAQQSLCTPRSTTASMWDGTVASHPGRAGCNTLSHVHKAGLCRYDPADK